MKDWVTGKEWNGFCCTSTEYGGSFLFTALSCSLTFLSCLSLALLLSGSLSTIPSITPLLTSGLISFSSIIFIPLMFLTRFPFLSLPFPFPFPISFILFSFFLPPSSLFPLSSPLSFSPFPLSSPFPSPSFCFPCFPPLHIPPLPYSPFLSFPLLSPAFILSPSFPFLSFLPYSCFLSPFPHSFSSLSPSFIPSLISIPPNFVPFLSSLYFSRCPHFLALFSSRQRTLFLVPS